MSPDGPQTELVVVSGADAVTYLDSQCTQDLSALAVGDNTGTLILAPNGDVVTIALVRRDADEVVTLEVPVATGALTVARLERFAIRAAVTFEGPVPFGAGRSSIYPDALSRIRVGVPGADELARRLVAHALPEELRLRSVSFTKGCYPGQELVARMQSRHAIPPYVLRRCTLDGPGAPGDVVGDPDKDGVLTSVALDGETGTNWALCVVHRRDAEQPTVAVHGSAATVARFE